MDEKLKFSDWECGEKTAFQLIATTITGSRGFFCADRSEFPY